jgi:S1-C subfamily serine protease
MTGENEKWKRICCTGLFAAILVGLVIVTAPVAAVAGADVRDSMVKIYCVQNEPDYDNPWNMKGPVSISGSGCIIEGNRILTNAHVVSDHTFIQVRLHGQAKKHTAKVLAVSHEADLALLTLEDASVLSRVRPLRLGQLPEIEQEVVVYGFPKGGDTLSTTKGVISRIEDRHYAHSRTRLLAGQLDAAVNPGNSGGPVLEGDRIVGVIMQSLRRSQNIGYMVPVTVIEHFLADMEDGRYDGFPEDGMVVQALENESLKQMHGLSGEASGALVTWVAPGSPAENRIFPGDILLAVDGHRIAEDGTVEFRPKERTGSDYYVKQHQVGEEVVYRILHRGEEKDVRLKLDRKTGSAALVSGARYDVRPSYFVYGGLVFCPVTYNYLTTWGGDWDEDAPYNLLTYFLEGKPERAGEEVVVAIKVLPSGVNSGYEAFVDERIVEVNGEKIFNLRDLVRAVESSSGDRYVVFKTGSNEIIALDRTRVAAEQGGILATYEIPSDRSNDLKSALSESPETSRSVAKLDPEAGVSRR